MTRQAKITAAKDRYVHTELTRAAIVGDENIVVADIGVLDWEGGRLLLGQETRQYTIAVAPDPESDEVDLDDVEDIDEGMVHLTAPLEFPHDEDARVFVLPLVREQYAAVQLLDQPEEVLVRVPQKHATDLDTRIRADLSTEGIDDSETVETGQYEDEHVVTDLVGMDRLQIGVGGRTTLDGVLDGAGNPIVGILVEPESDLENGFIFRRPSASYGEDQIYGTAQSLLVIKEGGGEVQADLILARLDGRDGAFGTTGGVHVATGLHAETGEEPTQGLWVQSVVDAVGIIVSAANDSPDSDYQLWSNHSGDIQAAVTADGVISGYAGDPGFGSIYVGSYPDTPAALTLGVGGSAVEGVLAVSSDAGQSGSTAAGQLILRNANASEIVFTIGTDGVMAIGANVFTTLGIVSDQSIAAADNVTADLLASSRADGAVLGEGLTLLETTVIAPDANQARLFLRDAAGVSELCVKWPDASVTVLASH